MATRPLMPFKRVRTRQKDVSLYIDDNFLNFLKINPLRNKRMVREVERHFKRAGVEAVESVKSRITMMNAVATGFMRRTVGFFIDVNANKNPMINMTIGTKAWYDILVHEGLGYHGRSKSLPAKYLPTDEQRAIVEPDLEIRKEFYKRSPKVPRPFLTDGIKSAKSNIVNEIEAGLKSGFRIFGKRKSSIPKHDIRKLSFGGTIG